MKTSEPLDNEQIRLVIAPEHLFNLSGIDLLDTIDSTNTFLLNKARQGVSSGWVCLAEEQTQGRGRLGKSWYSPRGSNIYCSLLWRFSDSAQDISGLGIAVGVMVVNALMRYGISSGLELKWPNDVLAMSRNVYGILLESNSKGVVVIGVGINVDVSGAGEKNWIDLMELTGEPVRRNFLVGLLLDEMLTKIPEFERTGLESFLPQWRKHDGLFNKNIQILTPEKNITGVMRGINAAGELLLENESGMQVFRYGEVSVRF